MRMSKYNFTIYDCEGNLILYNFLTGISSLTKVFKQDVDVFKNVFSSTNLMNHKISDDYSNIIDILLKKGILVKDNIDEDVLLDSMHYDKVFDNRLNLTILPTGNCNFRCSYCYESPQKFYRGSMSRKDQDALLNFVQKNIYKYNSVHIAWFGGEPLLEPKTIEYLSNNIIQMCTKRFLPYSAEITTNGYFLNLEMFDMLYKLKVYTYMVTIDGFKEHHDKLRFTNSGEGSYDTIISNLLRIRDNKQYKFARIIIRINVTNGFFDILDDFVNFMAKSFSDDQRFVFRFVPVGLNIKESNMLIESKELFLRLYRNNTYMNYMYDEELRTIPIMPENKCIATLKHSYVISSNLDVYKCCTYFDYEKNKIGYIDLKGDFFEDEITHRQWYLLKKYINKNPEVCNDCFYLPCCRTSSPGCPIRYQKQQDWQYCVKTDENFIHQLEETILYASKKYPCVTLPLLR